MSERRATAFTLVELLVVVAIIILLVSILTPSLTRALRQSHRAACASNVREIGRAIKTYAMTGRLNRGVTGRPLPDVDPTSSDWHQADDGNRKCLWLLVEHGLASPAAFVCPALGDFQAVRASDGNFGDRGCGYSYISMVEQTRTLGKTYTSMVVVGDLNPRFDVASRRVYDYRDLDHDGSVSDAENERGDELENDGLLKNSASHEYDGQNAYRLDGSVSFLTEPKVTTGSNTEDWIYEPEDGLSSGSDSDGECDTAQDVFLLN